MMTSDPTAEQLQSYFKTGNLIDEMSRRFNLADRAAIQKVEELCVALHNGDAFDLLRLVEEGHLQALPSTKFFTAAHSFCRLLPNLNAEPLRLMRCVEALVSRGGADLAANQPNVALRAWLANAPSRASEVINAACQGNDVARRNLTFALEATGDIVRAREFAVDSDPLRQLAGITALGRIPDDGPASRLKTFATFEAVLDRGAHDPLRASLLNAAMAVVSQSGDTPPSEFVLLVRRIVKEAGELTIHHAANVLWAYPAPLQSELVAALLATLKGINPANKGTVNELDLGLASLLDHNHDEAAISYVTDLLSQRDASVTLKELDSFVRTLLAGPSERLSRVIVRWLLIGVPRLCSGLSDALQGRDLDGPPVHLYPEDLAIGQAKQIFLCRKAIGWFFLKPTTAASIVVSVLRVCDHATAVAIEALLIDTLLLNFSTVRRYLEGLTLEGFAQTTVANALARNKDYLMTLNAIPVLRELSPSEHQRSIEQALRSDQMREAHKQARAQSVLLSLVSKATLLYGRASLSFRQDEGGTLTPVSTDLQSYGISYEMPRMEMVDPIGLDIALRVFKGERMAK